MEYNKIKWSLQMFAEGGEGAPAAGGEAQQGQAVPGTITPGPAARQGQQAGTGQEKKRSFDELLQDEEYKAAYDRKVRSTIANRFKGINAERSRLAPMYEALGRKYGVAANDKGEIDLGALSEAVMADDSLFEEEAAKMGVTVDGLRKIRAAEIEVAQSRKEREEAASQQAWLEITAEAERLKEIYPGLSLETEMQNPSFGRLMASLQAAGFPDPVRQAYESVHRSEIMSGAMQFAMQKTKQQISQSIQAGQKRPHENGAAAAADMRLDPAHLSREQREDIIRRAKRGEKITFR